MLQYGDDSKNCRISVTELVKTNPKSITKNCYRLMNMSDSGLIKAYNQWCDKIELSGISELSKCFKNIQKITNISKLRSFQFRLLHNKIFCNNVLYHWRVVNSQICDYCKYKQTPLHLLYSCSRAKRIWSQLGDYIDDFGFDFQATPSKIILNNFDIPIINFIVLVIKQMLFRFKCTKEELTWSEIVREIENLYEIELYNAILNRKLAKHVYKWKYLKPECIYLLDNSIR